MASEDPPDVPMSLEESVLVRRARRRAFAAASGCEVGFVTSDHSVKKQRGQITTQGLKCAYCDRTGKARFSEFKVDELKIRMGKSDEVCQTFHRLRKWLIQKILEHFEATGDREKLMRVSWPNHAEIHHVQITEVVWIKPEDDYVELVSYDELKAGDIVETAPDGTKLVKVTTSKVWRKQVRLVEQAKKSQKRGEDCTFQI